jgi:hypothetical protein
MGPHKHQAQDVRLKTLHDQQCMQGVGT